MKHVESKLFNQNGHFYFSFQICITCTYLTNIFGYISIYIYIYIYIYINIICMHDMVSQIELQVRDLVYHNLHTTFSTFFNQNDTMTLLS